MNSALEVYVDRWSSYSNFQYVTLTSVIWHCSLSEHLGLNLIYLRFLAPFCASIVSARGSDLSLGGKRNFTT